MKELIEKFNIKETAKYAQELAAACPVAGVNPGFSPKKIADTAAKKPDELLKGKLIWECLACGLCEKVSGGKVGMSLFVRGARKLAFAKGFKGAETHGGMLHTAQRMSADSNAKPKNNWVAKDLKIEKKGDYLYWTGNARLFDAALPELSPDAIGSACAAIRLLNTAGIKPMLLPNEKPSGHDLLWTGDLGAFGALAKSNIAAIKKSGAKTVIVSSPEDYYTLANDYAGFGAGFEVMHFSEIIAENIKKFKFAELRKRVTYHDPCRLGRGMGVYDAPREILRAIPGLELVEMRTSREKASCCGTSCWTNCTRYSKLMQVNRIREAVNSGAEMMITACPECLIHFRCAMRSESWSQVSVDVRGLADLADSLLKR